MKGWVSRRWPYLLIASLALNLFLVGLIGSAWIQREARHEMRRGNPLVAMWSEDALHTRNQALAQEVWERHRDTAVPSFRAIGDARRAAEGLLGQPEFDAAAYAAGLAEIRARTVEAQTALHDALVEFAERLSPEDRVRLVETGLRHRRGD